MFFQIPLAICISESLYGINGYLALGYSVYIIRPVCTHSLGLCRKASCGLTENDIIGFDFSPPQSIEFFIIIFHIETYAHFARWKLALFFQIRLRSPQHAERANWLCFSCPIGQIVTISYFLIRPYAVSCRHKLGLFFQNGYYTDTDLHGFSLLFESQKKQGP